MNSEFWDYLDDLVHASKIVIDRPKGSFHKRFPVQEYPVDYGYLQGTTSGDGGGVDIWVGSMGKGKVVGVQCSVDLFKRDTELKILYDCTEVEIESLQRHTNSGQMRAIIIKRNE